MNKEYVITEEMEEYIKENINLLSEYCQNKHVAKEYKKIIDEIINGKREFSKQEYLFLSACFELAGALHAYEIAMFKVAELEEQELNEYKLTHKLN